MAKLPSALTFTLVQEIPLSSNWSSLVTRVKLYGTGASAFVYIGTENNIYRIPVQSCTDYTTCSTCIKARDPYCGFDTLSCSSTDQSESSGSFLQDVAGGNTSLCGGVDSGITTTETISVSTVASTTEEYKDPGEHSQTHHASQV